MSTKLTLNVGDRVRNINKASKRVGLMGVVLEFGSHAFLEEDTYAVKFSNGETQEYLKSNAHKFLEKVEESTPACGCIHDELCLRCTRQVMKAVTFIERYGSSSQPGRQVIKKERHNIITGKTQGDMMKEHGTARGATLFNTRAIGKTTGQAFACISEAMVNPGKPVRLWEKDHAIWDESVSAPRNQLNEHFVSVVESLIEKNKLVGFHFDLPKRFMTFNPIVTEETYVTRSY